MHPPGADTVLVRHGDLNTKTDTVKGYMIRILLENIEAMLTARSVPGELDGRWNRPLVYTDEEHVETAAAAVADTFGVVSASPAIEVEPTMAAICDALTETARDWYDGGSFAVDAHRADKHAAFTSEDIGREGGEAIWTAVADSFDPAVDLENPDITFGVELRREAAYIYLESLEGPGGLPLGTQAPVVALVSGGIDSPVAAYELMKRGSPLRPVYVDLGEYGGIDHEARAMETVRTLGDYAPNFEMDVYRIPGGELVDDLVSSMEEGRMLSLRRFFYRAGEVIAETEGASGIVTGEAIGQKSSQTAQNLGVTSRVTDLPIYRPLLTWDKHQIVDRAREIGTFTDSTIDAGCNRIAPDRAETNARLEPLLAAEPDDLLKRAERLAHAAERIEP